MQTIKKINGINGGNLCRCSWEISEKQFKIEEISCSILSSYLISPKQESCRNFCCKGYNASPKLRQILPLQSCYKYDNKVYSCSKNQKLGYVALESFYQV